MKSLSHVHVHLVSRVVQFEAVLCSSDGELCDTVGRYRATAVCLSGVFGTNLGLCVVYLHYRNLSAVNLFIPLKRVLSMSISSARHVIFGCDKIKVKKKDTYLPQGIRGAWREPLEEAGLTSIIATE